METTSEKAKKKIVEGGEEGEKRINSNERLARATKKKLKGRKKMYFLTSLIKIATIILVKAEENNSFALFPSSLRAFPRAFYLRFSPLPFALLIVS
jgi:hypothetical protein